MTRFTSITIENGVVNVHITEEGLPDTQIDEIVAAIDRRTRRIKALSRNVEAPTPSP
jgi:hypothetical protein